MFCDNCGMQLRDDDIFCQNCGKKVRDGAVETQKGQNAAAVEIQEGQNAAAAVESQEEQDAVWVAQAEEEQGAAEVGKAQNGQDNVEAVQEAGSDTVLTNMEIVPLQGENAGRQFCPNCGTENGISNVFCKECGMPLGGAAQSTFMPMEPSSGGQKSGKKKWLLIAAGVAAGVLALAVIAAVAVNLMMGPNGRVLKAIANTMKDTPELVSDLKVVPDILSGNDYTVGIEMEYDGDTVNGEFRNTVKDKQIRLGADLDGEEIDFLCGVHSGVLKASISDLDYVFLYDPDRKNDGYLCDNFRKRELEAFNDALKSITTEKVSAGEIGKDFAAAFLQEFKALDLKKVKSEEFEVDKKYRECEGYKARINEKNMASFISTAAGRIGKRLDSSVKEDYEDAVDDIIDEIEDADFDMDIIFYLYQRKLAAVMFEAGNEEFCIEFRGSDYRMQNIAVLYGDGGRRQEVLTIDTRKKDRKEIIEIEAGRTSEDITITYDTKSGAIALEYDSKYSSDLLIEGVYKHSGSEASFALEEYEGDSRLEKMDIGLTVYVKKAVDIKKYRGEEFDLGSADEDEFEDLADDLEDYVKMFYRRMSSL